MINFRIALKQFILSTALVSVLFNTQAQDISIIPEPVSLEVKNGIFSLTANTVISVPAKNREATRVASYLVEKIKSSTGYQLKTSEGESASGIQLKLAKLDSKFGNEGYTLDVTDKGVAITANSPAGLFYGVQTLLQLLPNEIESKTVLTDVQWRVPAVSITDYPRFSWRGVMLDVSRH